MKKLLEEKMILFVASELRLVHDDELSDKVNDLAVWLMDEYNMDDDEADAYVKAGLEFMGKL